MARGILKFKLPEETREHLLATRANDLSYIITEFSEELRKLIKYNQDENNPNLPGLIEAQKIFLKKIEDEELFILLFDS